jgi:23S rRNA pseudouridine1911/1915/1917 synthase
VVGDVVYGGARSVLSSPRPMLHAMTLKFEHPVTGAQMQFDAQTPDDFKEILGKCS